ncbi:hypothetical protein C8J57DRAFT_1541162 [Mycena rebaudengoi]|nr:hypothetical protein C8J57DRAFT_1541162 [Mycena rebaudengoi]
MSSQPAVNISALAVETLTHVWSICQTDPHTLLMITHVSKHWRNAAIACHTLWTHIFLSDGEGLDLAKIWLQRAGPLRTDLVIDVRFPVASSGTWGSDPHADLYADATRLTEEMMHLIIPYSTQWRALSIHAPHYLGPFVRNFLQKNLPVPNLQSLSLVFEHFVNFHDIGNPPDNDELVNHPTLALQELDLACYPQLAFCGRLPSFEELDVATQSISLPGLLSLSLGYLRAQDLQHLVNHLFHPKLSDLTLRFLEDEDYHAFIDQLHWKYAPVLRTLSITSLPLSINSHHLTDLFQPFLLIECLHLDFDSHNGLPTCVWQPLLAAASAPEFLPKLTRLHFTAVQEFIAQRLTAGVPVLKLRIHHDSPRAFRAFNVPAWKHWLDSHTEELFVTHGPRPMWGPVF